MDDLHAPLGKTSGARRKRNWFPFALGCLAVGLTSFAAYVFIDARKSATTVVAINDAAPQNGTVSNGNQKSGQEGVSTDSSSELLPIDVPGSNEGGVKPFSPLLPVDGDSPETAPEAVFKSKPQPTERRSVWMPSPDLVEKSEFGPLPRISDGGVRPLDVYSMSSGVSGANRVAIVLGGLGLSQTGTQSAISDLPSEITMGFSPYGNSLQRWMQEARKQGHEVVLQLPMEPLGYPAINPGPRTLTSVATPGENLMNLRWALGRMTNYPVVMNYLGAGLTSKPDLMRPLLEEIRNRGLGFIDDGSASASTSIQLADQLRLPNSQGSLVIDTERNNDRIRANLQALESMAKTRGYAIGSASAFPETVAVLKEWAAQAQKNGIIIVPVSNLLKDYSR